MKSLVKCITALGVLLVASFAFAAPSTTDSTNMQKGAEAEKQRGFQVFRDYFSVAFTRAADSPRRKDFNIDLIGIFSSDELEKDTPFELVYLGTLHVGDEVPRDMWKVIASSGHLRNSPIEFLQYTAAQIVCRMVKRLKDGTPKEGSLVAKCACETVGREQCVVTHYYIAQLQGHVPVFRSLDELAAYMQTMEREIKERYGIATFERP